MEIDITQIAVGVIGIISAIVTGVVVPLIKSKMTNEQWNAIKNYALAGVQAAEILIGAGNGIKKFEKAKQYMELRLTPIPSRSQSRMPGRIWGWIRSRSQIKNSQ